MKSASSCPRVVRIPVRAPLRVMRAFVATVVPWPNRVVRESSCSRLRPSTAAAFPTLSMTPMEKSFGVDAAFVAVTLPASSTTMQSVNVPPVSTPMRKLTAR